MVQNFATIAEIRRKIDIYFIATLSQWAECLAVRKCQCAAVSAGPTGPWLVTRDQVEDVQNLFLHLDVNGKRMQTGNTNTMIISVAEIIGHLSGLVTLHPGDVIATGTPPGVGMGMKPDPVYLKTGDVIELTIQGLGWQHQDVSQDA